jgi:hypothetical protein
MALRNGATKIEAPMSTLTNSANGKFERDLANHCTLEVGVFNCVDGARLAVDKLLDVGFTVDEITVVCSDKTKEHCFERFDHQQAAGTHATKATVVGGAVGATLGTLAILTSAVATGSIALWAVGPIFAWTGGVAGGLVGAMMTRGIEKELANFYQQAVLDGDILVAAGSDRHDARELAEAAQVLAECGAKPLALPEG